MPHVLNEILVPILTDMDIVAARQSGRKLATELGFSQTDTTLIATAISELTRNIILYASQGEVVLRPLYRVDTSGRRDNNGIMVIARDRGPGIENISKVMRMGYSTSGSLGLGLPGVKRLMDEFNIDSQPGHGTTITVQKWKR